MIELTTEAIDAGKLAAHVNRTDCGAIVTFLGTVRDITGDVQTAALEYEAHSELAEKMLETIELETRKRWPVRAVAIIHRLGCMVPGEASVGIAVSSPHRADAFAACHFIIDRIKVDVPIWKRELSPEGAARWVHPGVTS
ncbi:MAG: molybdenum cofactor biosynthesis protein MoaE [Gemmataceae bacterium]